eukprot:1141469-Pelagomonas_calceolata.AAC.9
MRGELANPAAAAAAATAASECRHGSVAPEGLKADPRVAAGAWRVGRLRDSGRCSLPNPSPRPLSALVWDAEGLASAPPPQQLAISRGTCWTARTNMLVASVSKGTPTHGPASEQAHRRGAHSGALAQMLWVAVPKAS